MRKSLEFAEIRGRLQDAEVELVSLARMCQRVLQNLTFSGAERDGWCLRCHLRSIYLPDLGVHGCERVTQTSCLGSELTQFVQKESTQQIADFKGQSSNNRALTKDSKGNEQQVSVLASARITADRRSISL